MTATSLQPAGRHLRGFSLVEMMVGIVVGLVGLLVVYKTLSVWDTSSRTTVSGGEAQVAGTLGMFSIERDIKLAGMGFGEAASAVMGCTVHGTDSGGRVVDFPMYPVQIASSPSGGPDAINVLAGNSSFFVSAGAFSGSTGSTKYVTQRAGFRNGDVAIVAGNATGAAGSSQCQLIQVTDNANVDGHTIEHVQGAFAPDPVYGAASGVAQFNGAVASAPAFTSGTMYNLGPTPTWNRWEVVGGVLKRTDNLQGTPEMDVAEGVVDMRALYGIDLDGSHTITNAEWTAATPTDWTAVLAVRVALLVRSRQFEKPSTAATTAVTATAPEWGPAASRVPFTMGNVSGGADTYGPNDAVADNWRYYRYRVYEKVIPLRNMIWGTAP
jgi:type IV pilus assembly protein PilW